MSDNYDPSSSAGGREGAGSSELQIYTDSVWMCLWTRHRVWMDVSVDQTQYVDVDQNQGVDVAVDQTPLQIMMQRNRECEHIPLLSFLFSLHF